MIADAAHGAYTECKPGTLRMRWANATYKIREYLEVCDIDDVGSHRKRGERKRQDEPQL